MSSIFVVKQSTTYSVCVGPADKRIFEHFLNMFEDRKQSVNVSGWGLVRFALSNSIVHCGDAGQRKCIENFLSSMKRWGCSTFSILNIQDEMLARECKARWRKVRNLFHANSVLTQHFGILDVNINNAPCDYLSFGIHKICTSHISNYRLFNRYNDRSMSCCLGDYCSCVKFSLPKNEKIELEYDTPIDMLMYYGSFVQGDDSLFEYVMV